MRLSNSILNEVIREVAGEEVIPLVQALKNKKNFSEFKLAEQLKQEINKTRNMLYRLLKHNLVSFTRKKDKRKGWYIYYWTFNMKHVKYLLQDIKKEKLEKLRERIKREKGNDFFQCTNSCMRLSFDQATDFNYKCPECGELLDQQDNSKIINDIEKQIKALEKEVN